MAVPNAPGMTTLRESWQAPMLDAALLSVFMWILVSRSDGGAQKVFIGIWILILLGELFRVLRPVALLTPTEIKIVGLRPRDIPWGQIRDVTTEKRMGTMRMALMLEDGSRVLMDAPTASLLSRRGKFDKAVEMIRRQWIAQRGPKWSATDSARSRPTEEGPAGT